MNSPIRQNVGRHARGFTLLEIVFVLGMIAMIVAWVTLSTNTVDTEQQLREAASSIEVLTKRGRSIAVMQQRPYQITISVEGVKMSPQYVNLQMEEYEGMDEGEETSRETFEDIVVVEDLDPEVTYEIRRWRSDLWVAIEDEEKVVFTLEPVGLVEPISIRCSKGKSWIIQELHPLTGGVRDEEMSVEND